LMTCEAGQYSVTGYSSTFLYNQVIQAGTFAFTLTGYDATLSVGNNYSLTCEAGQFVYTGKDATFTKAAPVTEIISKGGIGKKKRTVIPKSQREEIEAVVREAFDKMDGTYVEPEIVKGVQKDVRKQIKEVDYAQYEIARQEVNRLLLQAQLKLHEYESELDDEESLLMLL